MTMQKFAIVLCLLIILVPLVSAEVRVIKVTPISIEKKKAAIPIEKAVSEPKFRYRVVFGKTIYDGKDEYYGIYLHAYRPNSSGIAFVYITAKEDLTINSVELCFPWGCYRAHEVPRSLEAKREAIFTIDFETSESPPFHPVLRVVYSNYTGLYTYSEQIEEVLCVYSDVQADAMEKIQKAAFLIGVKYVFGGLFKPQFTTGEGKELSYKAFQKLTEAIMNYKKGNFRLAKEFAEESLNLIEMAIKAEKKKDEIENLKALSSLTYSIGITIGLLSIGAGLILISKRK